MNLFQICYKPTASKLAFLFFLTALICCTITVFAQNKNKDPKLVKRVDSLVRVMENASTIAEKIEIEKEIDGLSKAIGYTDGLMTGKFSLIGAMISSSKHAQALKFINENIDKVEKLDVPTYTIQFLILKANCYSSLGLYKECRMVLDRAKSITLESEQGSEYHHLLGHIFSQIAWNAQAANGSTDSVLFHLRNSTKHFAKIEEGDEKEYDLFDSFNQIGIVYFDRKQYDSAEKYLPYIYKIKKENLGTGKTEVLKVGITDANLHYIRKDYQKSLTAYQDALALSKSLKLPYFQRSIYKGLAQVYEGIGDKKNEVVFLKKYADITDSLNRIAKQELRPSLEDILKDKNSDTGWDIKYYILIAVVLFAFFIGFLVFYRYGKQSDMFSKKSLQTDLKAIRASTLDDHSKDTLNDLVELAKQNNQILYARFNEYDPAFCQRLLTVAPDLSIAEQEFCIYIKLNFETKEIAKYAKFSVKAVQAKKYRIRKKLKILPKEDLIRWIINI